MKGTISAGGVVINKNGEILVVSQKGTSWFLPKGRVNPTENFIDAAKREIHEESGITDLQLIRELGSYDRPRLGDSTEIKTIYMFLFKTNEIDLKPIDPENPEAKWVNKNEVEHLLTAPKDQDFFKSIENQI